MAGMATDWRINLIKAHHGLFQLQAGPRGAAQSCLQCCDGWRDLLAHAFDKRNIAIIEGGMFQVLQIREKCGSLLFCWSGRGLPTEGEAIIREVIELGRGALQHMRGLQRRSKTLSFEQLAMTRCAACAKERSVDVKPALKTCTSCNEAPRGGTRTISFSRYDRAADCFNDFIPESQRIQE